MKFLGWRGGDLVKWARSTRTLSLLIGLAGVNFSQSAAGATLTVQTHRLGATPEIIAYNSGHFFPGSNTRDWWRYAGVNGARLFVSPSNIEANDDLAPVGDGVASEASFLIRKAALRADPLNPAYINWSYFTNRYETKDLHPANHIRVNYALGELHQLGVKICAQISASENRLAITNADDWGGKWELWQHYYAQAFHLGREFAVERYQMFNEPNHPNANGLTQANYLMRLQLASDAIQSALADVNALYGKSLVPNVLAPVTSGGAANSYTGGWGQLVVDNRHVSFLGQTDANVWVAHTYDYHEYNSAPASFGSGLATLNSYLTSGMSPEPRFPTSISEFNVHTGANFDDIPETMDYPVKYSRFGAIAVNLMANGINEMYAFKFSLVDSSNPNYPVQKNAMHYVDNDNAPYNIGGINKGGEVYRLFNKAFAAGRDRLDTTKGAGATNLDVHASYDPVRERRFLFSANNTSTGVALNFDLTAWNIPVGNRVLLEEVSETSYGGGVLWTTVPANGVISGGTQPSNSVWLLTVPTLAQAAEQIVPATEDAQVRDGANKMVNYGAGADMVARNDPSNTANRSVALMKFQLPPLTRTNVQFAILSLQAATVSAEAVTQAHVYGLDSAGWSEGSVNWDTTPNLKANVAAGNLINNSVIEDAGGTAHILGQLVVNSATVSERLIDVTDFLRGGTNPTVSFLVSQDPRWNLGLPSFVAGDTQPDGVRIVTKEGGGGPRLRLILRDASQPPVAVDDFAVTTQNTPVAVPVLANDRAVAGGVLSLQSFTLGAGGSVSNNGNGTLTYVPNPGFAGADEFGYTIVEALGGTNSATVSVAVYPAGAGPYWTNVLVSAEAFVRGGASATNNEDEVATGHLKVKYHASPFDLARKTYFQFDLSGLAINVNTSAVLTVKPIDTRTHWVQLWGLDQAYSGFNADITWNSAPANDTSSNDLLISGAHTATRIGGDFFFPKASTSQTFAISNLAAFIASNSVTLVFTGVDDASKGALTNDAGGLRLALNSAQLQVQILPPVPVNTNALAITGIAMNPDRSVTMSFSSNAGLFYRVQAATNLPATNWQDVSTNLAGTNGLWLFTDPSPANLPARFYRAVTP